MPIYFDPGDHGELTHAQVWNVSEELMTLCAEHLKTKYGTTMVPVAFAVFAGSGLSHAVCASVPQAVIAQTFIDAGNAMLRDGDDLVVSAPVQTALFN